MESVRTDACHATGNGGVLAANDKGVGRFLDDGLAVVAGVVFGVGGVNRNGRQTDAIHEGSFTYARHTAGNGDGWYLKAAIESTLPNGRHAAGEG